MDAVTLAAANAATAKKYDIVTASQAAALTTRLSIGVDDAVLLVLSDSTGVGRTRWVYLTSVWLGQQFPAYTVNYWQWNDTNQSYDALGTAASSVVIQTGTGTTAHSATTTNASPTIADTSIKAVHQGRPVSGPGIPANSFVGTVTDSASFLLSSSATAQVNVNATATAAGVTLTLGPRTLDVYNASVSGQIAPYPMATAARWTATTPKAPQCVIYSYGHNNGGMTGSLTYRLQAYPLLRKIQELWPQAGIIVTLQNPRATTDNGSGFAAERDNDLSRQRANAELASAEGYGTVDVLRRFLSTPNYMTTLLNADGLHPSDAAGSPAWAAEVQKHFKASLNVRPAGPPFRDTWKFIPATQFMAIEGAPTLALVNSVPVWSFDPATQMGVSCSADFPANWQAYDVYVIWTLLTGSGFTSANNQVRWDMSYLPLGSIGFSAPIDGVASGGQTAWSPPNVIVSGASNTGSSYQSKAAKMAALSTVSSAGTAVSNRPVGFRVRRIAADATDNLGENAYLHGLLLVRAA